MWAEELKNTLRLRCVAACGKPPGGKRRADNRKQRAFRVVIFVPVKKRAKCRFEIIRLHSILQCNTY